MVTGFELLNHNNTRDDLLKYREQGALRGVYLGFPILFEIYTMSLPGVTDWTGSPQSGKTEFLISSLLNTSLYYGWKHFLYVPDIGDKNEILANIIHKISGKTFDKRYVNTNYIDEATVEKELQWVLEHFKILTKVDLKAKITPYQFWEMAAEMKREYGCVTATIDSWKDMKHDWSVFGREDKYLEDVLSYRNSMSEAHKMHFHTVIHPNKTDKDAKTGKRLPAGPYDLKGGTEWFNNGKCMVTIHRPDGMANAVDFIVTKAKPKSVAKLGTVNMFFDISKASYYWEYDNKKLYASQKYFKPTGLAISDEESNDDDQVPF